MLVVLLCLSVPTAGFAGIGVPSVSAEAAELVDSGTFGDNITWTLDSEGVLTVSGEGEMPRAHEVVWRQYYDRIYSVVVEEGITSLGDYAFYCFYSLTEVTLPDGLERIGESAFGYCESLATLVLPDSVTVIGVNAFSSCTALRELTVPAGVTEIGYSAFYSCSVESITVAEGNADYQSADGVLYSADMSKLIFYPAQKTDTAFTVPETVTYIEDYAFAYNTYLTAVSIPDCVSYVGIGAFLSCSALTEVNIPADMQILSANTFNGCTSLESFTVPAHITRIDNGAFFGCESLMQLTILNPSCNIWWGEEECEYPANVTVYGYDGSTAQIGAEANNLTFVSLGTAPEDPTDPEEPTDPDVPIEGPTTASGTAGDSVTWTLDSDGLLTVSGVGEIRQGADYSRFSEEIISIVVENGITLLGSGVFSSLNNVTTVSLPESVTTIGAYAFAYCYSLAQINIPDAVTFIGNNAFTQSDVLEQVSIPANVTEVAPDAFSQCNSLQSINVDAENENYASVDGVLYNKDVTRLFAYPAGKTDASFVIPDGVTEIVANAFIGADFASVTIPNSVGYIGGASFAHCYSLTQVDIPASVTQIGQSAFECCYSLLNIFVDSENKYYESVDGVLRNVDGTLLAYPAGRQQTAYTVPDGTAKIADSAFSNCSSLESVVLPDGVVSIGEYAFHNCRYLTSVNIPDGVTSLGYCCFDYCEKLANISLPDSVTEIGSRAFSRCFALTSITVPQNVTRIEYGTFEECDALASITVLNPNCYIEEYDLAIPVHAAIYGYDGSTAQAYAESYDRTFVSLGAAPEVPTDPEEPTDPDVPVEPDVPDIPTDGPTTEDGTVTLQSDWQIREDNTVAIDIYFDNCFLMKTSDLTITYDPSVFSFTDMFVYGTDAEIVNADDYVFLFGANETEAGEVVCGAAFKDYLYGALDWESMGLQVNTDHFHVGTIYLTVTDEQAFYASELAVQVTGTIDFVTEEQNTIDFSIIKEAQDLPVDDNSYFTVESTGLKDADGIVEVDIYLHDFAGLSAFNFYLDIDETLFSYAGLEAGADALAVNTAMPNEIYLECNQHNGQVELGGYFTHCLYSAEHYNNASIHADRFHLATVLLQADENAEELQINATSKVDFEGFEADGFTYPAIGMVKNKTASCTVEMSCDHNYQFVKVITPATCVQQGSDLYVCTVCGEEMTATVSMDPENHAGLTEIRNAVSATCGKDGYTGDTYCLDCGVKTANGTTVPATGNHTWDNGVQTLAPTYTAPGVKTFTCTVCGATRTEEIAQLESVFEEDEEQVVIIEEVGLVTKAGATVTEFLEKASEGTVIVNAKGEELAEDVLPGTGCVLVLPDGTEHTIVIPGDINGDGEILSSDARKALRSAVGLENLQGAYSTAADVDATDGIAVADARKILRASVHLDDPDEWFDVFKSNTAA